jgi:hypothetical protein
VSAKGQWRTATCVKYHQSQLLALLPKTMDLGQDPLLENPLLLRDPLLLGDPLLLEMLAKRMTFKQDMIAGCSLDEIDFHDGIIGFCVALSEHPGWGHPLSRLATKPGPLRNLCRPQLQCLRACRQVYMETCPVLWSCNTFAFHNPESFRAFMAHLNAGQRRLITDIHLALSFSQNWASALKGSTIRSLTGLARLHLQIDHRLLAHVRRHDKQLWVVETSGIRSIANFKLLPLRNVTVRIKNLTGLENGGHFKDKRIFGRGFPDKARQWCRELEERIRDPEGPRRWREEQGKRQRSHRQPML